MPNEFLPLQTVELFPEPCPAPMLFTIDGCQDSLRVSAPDTAIASLGRVVQIDVTIKNVCPGKRVAVTVILMELDENDAEQPRGVKHLLLPASTADACQDITLRCISFSVPEALDPQNADSLCKTRRFSARVIANYVDTDFACCDEQTITL